MEIPMHRHSLRAAFSSELVNFSAVAFGGFARRRRGEIHSRFALLSDPESQFAARLRFVVERLSYRRRTAYLTQKEDFYLKIATLVPDL